MEPAEMLNISPRSVRTAIKVEREAPAKITEAVKSGAMSVTHLQNALNHPATLPVLVNAKHPDTKPQFA